MHSINEWEGLSNKFVYWEHSLTGCLPYGVVHPCCSMVPLTPPSVRRPLPNASENNKKRRGVRGCRSCGPETWTGDSRWRRGGSSWNRRNSSGGSSPLGKIRWALGSFLWEGTQVRHRFDSSFFLTKIRHDLGCEEKKWRYFRTFNNAENL